MTRGLRSWAARGAAAGWAGVTEPACQIVLISSAVADAGRPRRQRTPAPDAGDRHHKVAGDGGGPPRNAAIAHSPGRV